MRSLKPNERVNLEQALAALRRLCRVTRLVWSTPPLGNTLIFIFSLLAEERRFSSRLYSTWLRPSAPPLGPVDVLQQASGRPLLGPSRAALPDLSPLQAGVLATVKDAPPGSPGHPPGAPDPERLRFLWPAFPS